MEYLFVCYPKCTTCQKAEKWLESAGIRYTVRDIKTDNPNYEEIKNGTKSGLPLKALLTPAALYISRLG